MWAVQFDEGSTFAWDENGNVQIGGPSSPPSDYSIVDDTTSPVTYMSNDDINESSSVPTRPSTVPNSTPSPLMVIMNGPLGPLLIPVWGWTPSQLLAANNNPPGSGSGSNSGSGSRSGSGSNSGSGSGSNSGSGSGGSGQLNWETYYCGGYSVQLSDNLYAVAFCDSDGSWMISWASTLEEAGNLAQRFSQNEPLVPVKCPCIDPIVSAALGDTTFAVAAPPPQ